MKIVKTNAKNDSQWANKMAEASVKKYSSLSVESGKVMCPLTNSLVSTVNCEICQYCQGVDFDVKSSTEYIKCAHKESANVKKAQKDEVERLYVSEDVDKKENTEITPDDLKSIFARSTSKFDDIDEEDLMNGNKIVSAKNISENESDGTSNFVPKHSNSIFDSDAIAKLVEEQKNEEEAKEEAEKKAEAEREEAKKGWETETKERLDGIGYEPKGPIMSTASETESNNPDVSDYKFSIFDNVDERLENIPDLTEGEKLKAQAEERKEKISRAKKEDDWESNHKENTSTSGMVKNFFDQMFEE